MLASSSRHVQVFETNQVKLLTPLTLDTVFVRPFEHSTNKCLIGFIKLRLRSVSARAWLS